MHSRPLAKLLLVLAPGTTAIDLLNDHPGTAVLPSSRFGPAMLAVWSWFRLAVFWCASLWAAH